MNKTKPTYYLFKHKLSSVLMMVALLWLTVSIPFVYAAQTSHHALFTLTCEDQPDEECSNPLTNTTEEKTESGSNSLSEYLHEAHSLEHGFIIIAKYEKCHADDLYFAYHPELTSPPPDAIIA
jgi:hypothetical protein